MPPLDVPLSPVPITRSAIRIAAGRLNRGSTPYFRFGAQPRIYPFDWHGWPGGVPQSRAAAETRELSGSLGGSGDLYESGLSPYSMAYPPLAHRGFFPHGATGLDGLWSDLSANEQKVLTLGAVAAGAFLFWKMRRPKGKRKNPARPRRGRKRRSVRARRRRWR
jgi:hypothetical protein